MGMVIQGQTAADLLTMCQKEEHLRPDYGLTTGNWSHGSKSEDKGVGRLPYDHLTSIFPKTFLKLTLLSVLLNFGGIFKLVLLTFFSLSISDNQVIKLPLLKVSDGITPSTLFITLLCNLSNCTEIICIPVSL